MISCHPHHAAERDPSAWVCRFAGLVPAAGEVLDVACGAGRHSRLFLARGHRVIAVDRDLSRIADLKGDPNLELVEADLEGPGPWPFGSRRFAGVVVVDYLWRPFLATFIGSLAPGGVLIYETFARGNERFGRPLNPDHLLNPGELLEAVRGRLHVVAFEQGEVRKPRPAVVQRLCAVNRRSPAPAPKAYPKAYPVEPIDGG